MIPFPVTLAQHDVRLPFSSSAVFIPVKKRSFSSASPLPSMSNSIHLRLHIIALCHCSETVPLPGSGSLTHFDGVLRWSRRSHLDETQQGSDKSVWTWRVCLRLLSLISAFQSVGLLPLSSPSPPHLHFDFSPDKLGLNCTSCPLLSGSVIIGCYPLLKIALCVNFQIAPHCISHDAVSWPACLWDVVCIKTTYHRLWQLRSEQSVCLTAITVSILSLMISLQSSHIKALLYVVILTVLP